MSLCSPSSPAPSQDTGPGEMGCSRGRGTDRLMRQKARVKPRFQSPHPPSWAGGSLLPLHPPFPHMEWEMPSLPPRMIRLVSFLPLPSSLLMLLPSKYKGVFPIKKAPQNLTLTQPLCSRHAEVMDTMLGSKQDNHLCV